MLWRATPYLLHTHCWPRSSSDCSGHVTWRYSSHIELESMAKIMHVERVNAHKKEDISYHPFPSMISLIVGRATHFTCRNVSTRLDAFRRSLSSHNFGRYSAWSNQIGPSWSHSVLNRAESNELTRTRLSRLIGLDVLHGLLNFA